ncbi:MAG: hypothetical protein H0V89_07795 [Deltaproteobacteria bacterium]|nr:hypothetical protein [Deltaproteobacteria bacterium]
MNRRIVGLSFASALVLAVGVGTAAQAAGPVRISDAYTDTFFDDFIFDLCGIETYTTVTERWTLKVYPDGSEVFHNVRTFVPDDPRIPIEKGAATSFNAPDGSRRVVGKPIQLFYPDGGVKTLDAGQAIFDEHGDLVDVRGRHDFIVGSTSEADLYCPEV